MTKHTERIARARQCSRTLRIRVEAENNALKRELTQLRERHERAELFCRKHIIKREQLRPIYEAGMSDASGLILSILEGTDQ